MCFVGVSVGSLSQAIASDDKLIALLFYLYEIKLKTELAYSSIKSALVFILNCT